jgi:hypothetical protein
MDGFCSGNGHVRVRGTAPLGLGRITSLANKKVGIIASQPFVNGSWNG